MTLMLSIHPVAQLIAGLVAVYAAWLGFHRTRSLDFGPKNKVFAGRNTFGGGIALVFMLGGIAAGYPWLK